MVAGTARTGQAAAHGGDLKDVTAPLLAHDRQRSAGHINDAIEICVHQRLESLRTQLLERSDVTVSRVIYDDIEVSENVNRHLVHQSVPLVPPSNRRLFGNSCA